MQLELFLTYAGVRTHEEHTPAMRDFLREESRVDKVSVLQSACKTEATVRGFCNLTFNFVDDAFVRDGLENSYC